MRPINSLTERTLCHKMESLRSMLLFALFLVFVGVKGEYPEDYDCEDFRQAKKEKGIYKCFLSYLLN